MTRTDELREVSAVEHPEYIDDEAADGERRAAPRVTLNTLTAGYKPGT
jgi:hypothetical protein